MVQWEYTSQFHILLVVSRGTIQLSVQFSICWKLTVHCFGNRWNNLPVYWWQPTIYFYHASILVCLWSCCWSQCHFNVTSKSDKEMQRSDHCSPIVLVLNCCLSSLYLGVLLHLELTRWCHWWSIDDLPWWSTMDFSTVSTIIIIQIVRFDHMQWSSNNFKQYKTSGMALYDTTLVVVINDTAFCSVRVFGSDEL